MRPKNTDDPSRADAALVYRSILNAPEGGIGYHDISVETGLTYGRVAKLIVWLRFHDVTIDSGLSTKWIGSASFWLPSAEWVARRREVRAAEVKEILAEPQPLFALSKGRRTKKSTDAARLLYVESVRAGTVVLGQTTNEVGAATGMSAEQVRDAVYGESADAWRGHLVEAAGSHWDLDVK